jgi:hypothetical protein
VTGYSREDIGEPGLRIDIIHPGAGDEAVHIGGALVAAVRRDAMMPDIWEARLRSPTHSIRLRGRPRWSSAIRSMTALAI